MLSDALLGKTNTEITERSRQLASLPSVAAVERGAYLGKQESEIQGSGYCVESLEAALWCFARTSSFEDAVLAAVNLGDDADTTAAITGQLAGAFYGAAAIPQRWLEKLHMKDEISRLASALLRKTDPA